MNITEEKKFYYSSITKALYLNGGLARLSGNGFKVLGAIEALSNGRLDCRIGDRALSEAVGMAHDTVRRARSELVSMGLIHTVVGRGRAWTRYILIIPSAPEISAPKSDEPPVEPEISDRSARNFRPNPNTYPKKHHDDDGGEVDEKRKDLIKKLRDAGFENNKRILDATDTPTLERVWGTFQRRRAGYHRPGALIYQLLTGQVALAKDSAPVDTCHEDPAKKRTLTQCKALEEEFKDCKLKITQVYQGLSLADREEALARFRTVMPEELKNHGIDLKYVQDEKFLTRFTWYVIIQRRLYSVEDQRSVA